MNTKYQLGVGMIEVLVSLVLLSIAVLGFSALQFRALDAMQEASDRTVAMSLARDLAERIRVNRTQLVEYKTKINGSSSGEPKACKVADSSATTISATPMCNRAEMVSYDVSQVLGAARQAGMKLVIDRCQGGDRECVYIAWGNTIISATNVSACMSDGVYVAGATCLVMEAYGT